MSQFIFHAILTKIQVFQFARGFGNWQKNDKNCRIKVNGQQLLICTESLFNKLNVLSLGYSLENLI